MPGAPVLVAGGRVTGRAVQAALTRFGAVPTVCDDDSTMLRQYAEREVATVDPAAAARHIGEYALVVTSPGFSPATPLLAAAAAEGIPIWGDVELAWRLDVAGSDGPPHGWLVVTAPGLDELRAAVKQVERAANQALCETRVLYGQQAQGFVTAALPLGRSAL